MNRNVRPPAKLARNILASITAVALASTVACADTPADAEPSSSSTPATQAATATPSDKPKPNVDKTTQRAIDQLKNDGITLGEVIEVAYQGKYPSFVVSPDSRFSKFDKENHWGNTGGDPIDWTDKERGEAQAFAANYFFNYNIIGKLRTDWDQNRPAFSKDLKSVVDPKNYEQFADASFTMDAGVFPGDIFAGEYGKRYTGYTLASDGATPRMLVTDIKVLRTEEGGGQFGVTYKGDYVMALVHKENGKRVSLGATIEMYVGVAKEGGEYRITSQDLREESYQSIEAAIEDPAWK